MKSEQGISHGKIQHSGYFVSEFQKMILDKEEEYGKNAFIFDHRVLEKVLMKY